jgi:hypothetical protein
LEQYSILHGPHRKGESLNRALDEIEKLQRSLKAARGRVAQKLLPVANEWVRIVAEERQNFRAAPDRQREIPIPFVFGPPITVRDGMVFTGRLDIVRHLEESLLGTARKPTLLLYGARRMGKSSILHQLPRLLGPYFAPALVDCQNPAVTGSPVTLLHYLARALSAGMHVRRVVVPPPRRDELEPEPFAAFDGWIDAVERALPERMQALLCLDEYESLQRAVDVGWGGQVLDFLRHTLQHRQRLALLFTGAHTFEEQGSEWTHRFVSARRVRVSFLRREEVLPLLTPPVPQFEMTYAVGAKDRLIAATNGQPFLTQAVAYELVQLLNETCRKEATMADVDDAVARALLSASAYFANVWFDAGTEGQAILRAVARREAPPDHPKARAWLLEHDVLDSTGGFAVPMMQQWVMGKGL